MFDELKESLDKEPCISFISTSIYICFVLKKATEICLVAFAHARGQNHQEAIDRNIGLS